MMKCEWILCPVCGSKTRNKIRKAYIPSKYYAPDTIFNCTYAPYYFQAIKIRFEILM